MSEQSETGTRTVRIDAELAKKLQTIAALKDQMGARFKPVEFLNENLRHAIESLFDSTTKEFMEFQNRDNKGKQKPSGEGKK